MLHADRVSFAPARSRSSGFYNRLSETRRKHARVQALWEPSRLSMRSILVGASCIGAHERSNPPGPKLETGAGLRITDKPMVNHYALCHNSQAWVKGRDSWRCG